jgi:molecular chaperone DnaK
VLQGEGETTYSPGIRSLGKFQLIGIPPAPRGVPQIEVAFDIDANGIVNVSAKDLATGKEQQMTITGGTALSKDEIDKMQKEAEAFAAEDHKRREAAEARNQGDSLAYQIDKALSEYGEKVPADEKQAVETANADLKEALKSEDLDRIKQATEVAMTAFQAVGRSMYASQQAQAASEAGAPGSDAPGAGAAASGEDGSASTHTDGDVVEGEIVDEGGES